MSIKIIAAAFVSLTCAATAAAAQPPTLDPPTTFKAGEKAPVTIPGNDLHRGDTIRKGTRLRRWKVTMHGSSNARTTLACPAGMRHAGLGARESGKVFFKLAKGASYGHRTLEVQFYARPGVDPDGASGHVYALCRN